MHGRERIFGRSLFGPAELFVNAQLAVVFGRTVAELRVHAGSPRTIEESKIGTAPAGDSSVQKFG